MQVAGSLTTILARGVAPNNIGPGLISPDISGGTGTLWQAWFWVGLICNLSLCLGFLYEKIRTLLRPQLTSTRSKFYRKEQLQKP
jgi:alpha-1,3-glucan synthase